MRSRFPLVHAVLLVLIITISPGPRAGAAEEHSMSTRTLSGKRNVAILLYNGVELLDFAGPGEVFKAAANSEAFDVYTVSADGEQIHSQGFLKVLPNYSFERCPPPAILVLPGGSTGPIRRAEVLDWIREKSQDAEIVMSVCTGALALADAGMLDGIEATTHWSAIEPLRKLAPETTVEEDVRFVDAGHIVTCAGVSAGIDGALHVVARLHGEEIARNTARYMEYDWTPEHEYDAPDGAEAAFLKGDWETAAPLWKERADTDPADHVAAYRAGTSLAQANRGEEALPYLERAQEAGMDDTRMVYRLAGLQVYYGEPAKSAANFRKMLDRGERSWQVYYNLACAEAKQGHDDLAIEALENAVDAGFSEIEYLKQDEDLKSLRDDERFQVLMTKLEE